jgi:hypothetical protein
MAVTVTAMVPFLSPEVNGITARAPTFSLVPGAVASPGAASAGVLVSVSSALVVVEVVVSVGAGVGAPVVLEPQPDRRSPAVAAAAMNRGPRACVTAELLAILRKPGCRGG